jgi:D-3-phosphoglycerate dehydrogenase
MKIICLVESPITIQTSDYAEDDIVFEYLSNIKVQNHKEVIALFTKVSKEIDANLINKFPNLKYIGIPATGSDIIDKDFCVSKKIKIITLKEREFKPTLNAFSSTSEIFLWHLLNLARNCYNASESVRQGEWQRDKYIGTNLRNLNLGIVGLGRIGKQIASLGQALGMNISFFDTEMSIKQNNTWHKKISLEDLFANSNVISININAEKENIGLIDSNILGNIQRKPFYLINTSRGNIVNENLILKLLATESIDGYGADVLTGEGSADPNWLKTNPIWQAYKKAKYNISITPHIGGATYENMFLSEDFIIRKLISMIRQ